jgi:hypothetical protein
VSFNDKFGVLLGFGDLKCLTPYCYCHPCYYHCYHISNIGLSYLR